MGWPEMPLGEGVSRAAFQVALELAGATAVGEGHVADEFSRAVLRGVGGTAFVVIFEACFEIVGEADVSLGWMIQATEEVDVMYSDENKTAALLRQGFEGHFSLALCASEKWSGRRDSNSRPLAPHASALPGCATSRLEN